MTLSSISSFSGRAVLSGEFHVRVLVIFFNQAHTRVAASRAFVLVQKAPKTRMLIHLGFCFFAVLDPFVTPVDRLRLIAS